MSSRPEPPDDGLRLLQVVGDTDATHDSLAALDLHRRLVADGLEVRTLALAPGRHGHLSGELPFMSPSTRSLAAHTQLRREQHWADVVLLRGELPAAAAGLARVRGAPPTVLALSDEAAAWSAGPVPSRVLRLAGRATRVVVTGTEDRGVGARLGVADDAVDVVPFGIEPFGRVSAGRRAAARELLGLPPDGIVVHLVSDDRTSAAERAEAELRVTDAGLRWTARSIRDDGAVLFGTTPEDEVAAADDESDVAMAAADVVAVVGSTASGPPPALLRAASAGLAVVADRPFCGLVDPSTGWSSVAELVEVDAGQTGARGSCAAERVRQRFALGVVGARWRELLAAALDA